MNTLGILDLLALRGFDIQRSIKLVRHQDQRLDMNSLIRRHWFETYQAYQSDPIFDDLAFIISFIGDGGTRARLIGIYRVHGRYSRQEAPPFPPDCPYVEWSQSNYFYDFRKEPGFEDLENRVVIEWGKGTRMCGISEHPTKKYLRSSQRGNCYDHSKII